MRPASSSLAVRPAAFENGSQRVHVANPGGKRPGGSRYGIVFGGAMVKGGVRIARQTDRNG
jgi:hypothetical protein